MISQWNLHAQYMKPSQDNLIYQATHCHTQVHSDTQRDIKFYNQNSRSETNVERKKKHENIMRTENAFISNSILI